MLLLRSTPFGQLRHERPARRISAPQRSAMALFAAAACTSVPPSTAIRATEPASARATVLNDFCQVPCNGLTGLEDCTEFLTYEEAKASLDALAKSWDVPARRPLALRRNPRPPRPHLDRRGHEDDFGADPFPSDFTNDVLMEVAPGFTAMAVLAGKRLEAYLVCSKTSHGGMLHIQWATERIVAGAAHAE